MSRRHPRSCRAAALACLLLAGGASARERPALAAPEAVKLAIVQVGPDFSIRPEQRPAAVAQVSQRGAVLPVGAHVSLDAALLARRDSHPEEVVHAPRR